MADWRVLIRERLAGVPLRPTDELDIVEELAQHLEDRYRDLRAGGAEDEDAVRKSLEELDGYAFLDSLKDLHGKTNDDDV
jgi:hypothetical protein